MYVSFELITQFFAECVKWGKTAFNDGVEKTLKAIPSSNAIHLMIATASKMKDLAVAHNQLLCVPCVGGGLMIGPTHRTHGGREIAGHAECPAGPILL